MGAWFVACGEAGCAAANEGGLHKATQGCAQGVVFASPQSLYRRSRLALAKTTYNRVGVQRSTACLAHWVGSRRADCIPLSVASGRPTQSSIWWACCVEAHPAASKVPRRRCPLRTPYCFVFVSPPRSASDATVRLVSRSLHTPPSRWECPSARGSVCWSRSTVWLPLPPLRWHLLQLLYQRQLHRRRRSSSSNRSSRHRSKAPVPHVNRSPAGRRGAQLHPSRRARRQRRNKCRHLGA